MHRLPYILSILILALVMSACGDDDSDTTTQPDTTQDGPSAAGLSLIHISEPTRPY